MMKLPLLKLLCACAALGAFAARAQNHTAQQIARDPAAAGIDFSADDRPWSGQAELTFLSTVGNTETLSTGAKASGKRNWQFWALMARGEYLQTRDKGKKTAESYLFGLRGVRKFPVFDVFSDNEYQRNTFGGFENLYKIALGLGREFFKGTPHLLRFEVGPAFVIEERVSGETIRFGSLSVQALHKWKITDKVELNDRFSYLTNFEDMDDARYEFEVGLAAPVSTHFSLKASYLAQYRNRPPVNTDRYDGKTTISLLATF